MEIGGVKSGSYTPGVSVTKTESKSKKAEQNLARAIQDSLRISQEGRDKAHKASTLSWLEDQIKSASDQADAQAKQFKVMSNCQKIAARIMRGDKVDPKDMQYLMEHDSKSFELAMAMRKPKKDPEKSKRITEDEEEKSQDASSVDSGSDCSTSEGGVEAAAPAEGGTVE